LVGCLKNMDETKT